MNDKQRELAAEIEEAMTREHSCATCPACLFALADDGM